MICISILSLTTSSRWAILLVKIENLSVFFKYLNKTGFFPCPWACWPTLLRFIVLSIPLHVLEHAKTQLAITPSPPLFSLFLHLLITNLKKKQQINNLKKLFQRYQNKMPQIDPRFVLFCLFALGVFWRRLDVSNLWYFLTRFTSNGYFFQSIVVHNVLWQITNNI